MELHPAYCPEHGRMSLTDTQPLLFKPWGSEVDPKPDQTWSCMKEIIFNSNGTAPRPHYQVYRNHYWQPQDYD